MHLTELFDLDGCLLDTEHGLYEAILADLAEAIGGDRGLVNRAFARCNLNGFTYSRLFAAVGLPAEQWYNKEVAYLTYLATHAEDFLFPGVLELLRERSTVARLVLITAGDEAYQRRKVDALRSLHGLIAPEDRHFIALDGSKGEVIATRYAGRRRLVEDSATRLLEALMWSRISSASACAGRTGPITSATASCGPSPTTPTSCGPSCGASSTRSRR